MIPVDISLACRMGRHAGAEEGCDGWTVDLEAGGSIFVPCACVCHMPRPLEG